ncbi:DHA2 family efflux MFS transporter permease subunit [Streptomyces sp. NEAU-sy36]|uniref:DHA2 family efflux MFS transporter permease subunit n=1 Tax=unclassified Streptomyces TaxID=2593676 RepID=UPI0015D6578F|nr:MULTISPECIES: DHA2 family efflux MFS transporter permease subunit [unclassified Streptomyces]QLJ03662.1 DHA2 family efflux MFS transporter permease subunit [Streptomyces sp. NEAU-sy36]
MPFSPALRRVLIVTTLGSFLAFLDSSIVNVALHSLSDRFDTTLSTIQWTVTAYLLALAAVLPVSGWAAARFGAKRMYALSIGAFTLGSLACGLSHSIGELIAFRAVQGAAAAVAAPVAQMIAVRAAGPERLAKVMSVAGVPTILAPILGPAVGGLLLDHAGWRWIFLINVPIGALIVVLALRLLEPDEATEAGRLDLLGFLMLALGCVGLTYGLNEFGTRGDFATWHVLPWVVGGVLLLAAFVIYGLRATVPLTDLRLYRNARYTAASVANFFLGAVLFGSVILMPLYFQIVRHESPVATGMLLIPQSIGVAIAVGSGSKFVESLGIGRAALLGGLVSTVGTLPFVLVGAHTSYWLLGVVMVLRGFGIGATMVPVMAAAFRVIPPTAIADATVQTNVLQRIGGSLSTAILAAVLQSRLDSATTPAQQAAGFGTAFWGVLAIGLCATAPAFLLLKAEPAGRPAEQHHEPAASGHQ